MVDKIERAIDLGVLVSGWSFTDYALDCIPNYGWIDNVISGEKGAGKSNYLLQSGYRLFHGFDRFEVMENGRKKGFIDNYEDMEAWEKTLAHLIFRPADFAKLLRRVMKDGRRLSWLGADDFNLHFPRSMYSTNRAMWEEFQKSWEAFRAQLSVFQCTVPNKSTVISVILRDLNFDTLVSNRHKVENYRWYYDISYFRSEEVVKLRVDIEYEDLKLSNVPKEIWARYWQRKQTLVDQETGRFQRMLEDMETAAEEKPESYICPKCRRDMGNAYNHKIHVASCPGSEKRFVEMKPKKRRDSLSP